MQFANFVPNKQKEIMKAIGLIRISTFSQELSSQRDKVREAMLADGYTEENIILIEDIESGVKLKEEERNGLNKMKEYIEADPSINAVYVFEVSRISRRPGVIYSIRDYLTSKNICLVVLNPSFRTLKENGEVDTNSNLYLGIFGAFSENESIMTKIRTGRGRNKAIAEGRFIGGTVLFGYKNEKGYLVIDPSAAIIVKEIFEKYSTGNYSVGMLAKEYNFSRERVAYILGNSSYAGLSSLDRSTKAAKSDFKLPPIITEDLYKKVQKIKENNIKGMKKTSGNIYLCKSLLKCVKCLKSYIAHLTSISYRCKCSEGGAIPINLLDSFIWSLSKENRKRKLTSKAVYEKELERLQNSIYLLQDNFNKAETQLIQLNKKRDKLALMVLNDKISNELAENQYKEIDREIKKISKEKDNLVASIEDVDRRIKNLGMESLENPLDLDNINDPAEMYRIIKEEIYSIVVMEKKKNSMVAKIAVSFNPLDLELEDSRIEHYMIDTKNRTVTDQNGKEVKFSYIERFILPDNIKEAQKKAREKYNAKKALGGSK